MDIHLGHAVIARDGRPCGRVQHVVVNPGTRRVESVVVEFGPGSSVVVPVGRVRTRDGDLAIDATREEISAMPRFLTVDYCLPTDAGTAWEGAAAEAPCPTLWSKVPAPLEGEQRPTPLRIEHLALSPGDVVVDKGMAVECRDGRCGEVADVVAGPGGELAGMVVRRGLFFGRDLLIPAGWIDRVESSAVHLRASREQLKKLAESEAKHEWDQPP